jgi:hypothetical protein
MLKSSKRYRFHSDRKVPLLIDNKIDLKDEKDYN